MSQTELYEELKSYYPRWITELKEFDAILYAQSKMLAKCEVAFQQIKDDSTISKCSESRLDELIKFFKLDSTVTDIESKRLLAKSCFSKNKIDENQIKSIIFDFLGVDSSITISNLILTINIIADNVDTSNLNLCIRELKNKLNCGIDIQLNTTAIITATIYSGAAVSEYGKEYIE